MLYFYEIVSMAHTKAFLKDFHAASVIFKNKDEITTCRLQKLQQYFNYVASNQIECDVNKLILAHLSFNGINYSARMGDLFAYYGEFKLIEYLVKFYSLVIDQQVMDCAMFGGDQQTIQYIQKIQPGLISDYSLFELPVMTDTVDKAIRRLDLWGTLQLRRVSRRFSAYREALVDQLILQLQSPASFDRIKALRGLISITRQLTDEVKRYLAERINKINFYKISKKSFHFDDNPKKIITYDNKTKLLTEYLNLPTDHEIPNEPEADERCFDYSHIEKHLYLKLLHQLGCVSKYYEVFCDSIGELDFEISGKLVLLLMSDPVEVGETKSAVVFDQSEFMQLQQEIQSRIYLNQYANDESGIEQQKSDIEQLVTFLSINLSAQHDTGCVTKLIQYLLESLLPTNYPTLVDFYFDQLTHLLTLVSDEELLTRVWPKFETLLRFFNAEWPFAKGVQLKKQENDEKNIHYIDGLIGLFFNVFLPKLSQLQIQSLISNFSQFDLNPKQVKLADYLSIALMVYWKSYNTPEYLAKLARKVFYILKQREDKVLVEPLINSNLMLNVIFYRLSLKNRLKQFVPYLLRCIDYSDENIEVSLQLINLIIKYSTKQDRIHYFTTYEHSHSHPHPANPLIATISKHYENANGKDYEGGANAHIIEDIRLENELLFKLLPLNVLADEALHKIWNKIFVITDSKFSTEIITLYCKFALLLPTSIVINFLLDRIDSIFSTLRNIFINVGKRNVIYHVFDIIDLILQRLSKGEAHRQKFNDIIGMFVSKTLSLEKNYFKMTIIARLLPLAPQLQHDLTEYLTSISTRLNNVLKGAIENFDTIRDVMRLLAMVSPCLSEGDHVLLENILQLNRIAIQNISDNNFTMLQSQTHLTQCYVLLRANLSPQNKADLFRLVCDLFLTVIENYRKNSIVDRDFHENYKHILTLFLNLFDNNSDVDCFKNYLLPALSNIFWYLKDDLIEFLYHKLHYSKFNSSDKKIGYHLLFSLSEFHQAFCALLVSKPNKSIQQLLFCFTLMDFDKTRCIEFLNLKESDKAIDLVNMLAEDHASLITNSKPARQITHGVAQTVADVPMQDQQQTAVMLMDSGNSLFSGATKRHAGVEDNKDNKARRTDLPSRQYK